jgi:tetratricopeptide (TPR) repeat protein
LRQAAKAAVLEAVPLAQHALRLAASESSANLAMADLLRLQGKSSRDVRRYLDAARRVEPEAVELALIEGLLLVRDGKLSEARQLFGKADSGTRRLEQTGDVRLRFRSAMAAFADGKAVDARAAADAVIAAQPEHEAAKALLQRLEHAVTDTDPLPPEEDAHAGSGAGPISGADSYEKLVQKANQMAVNRGCAKAIDLFQAALDKTPNGIDALIGLGYCHIETKQFSSANSRFRTVLALQSKNERALWGIAQLYQEQGLKTKAIEAYRGYLEVFPGSGPAKRQLDRLGASVDEPAGSGESSGSSGGSASGSGPEAPDLPTPAPAPTPTNP